MRTLVAAAEPPERPTAVLVDAIATAATSAAGGFTVKVRAREQVTEVRPEPYRTTAWVDQPRQEIEGNPGE